MNQKTIFSFLAILALILIASPALAVWNTPTAAPPDGNAAEPINISGSTQAKGGRLGLGSLFLPGVSSLIFNVPATAGQFLTTDSSGNSVWATPSGGNPGPGGGDTFWGGSLTSSIFNLNSGLVGIGTNTPNSKLTVAGGDVNVTSAGRGVISTVSGDSNWANLVLRHGSSGNMVLTPATAGGVQRDVIVNGGALGVGTNPASGAISGVKLDVAGNARVSGNLTTTGRVGVGVTNPSYPLHVSGKILATGEICTTVSGQELCLSTAGTPPTQPGGGGTGGGGTTSEPNRFGGMYQKFTLKNSIDLLFPDCIVSNPMASGCTCPSGFQPTQIYEYGNFPVESKRAAFFCWK